MLHGDCFFDSWAETNEGEKINNEGELTTDPSKNNLHVQICRESSSSCSTLMPFRRRDVGAAGAVEGFFGMHKSTLAFCAWEITAQNKKAKGGFLHLLGTHKSNTLFLFRLAIY